MANPLALPDFQLLFQSAPGLYLVLSPDFTIVAVSGAYERATMTERSRIVGRNIFAVFPDDPADPAATGVANLKASLERVLGQKRSDAMAVQKYAIRRPDSEGGGFEERHWSPVNSPVLDAQGELVYIIHRVEDVTDFIRVKQQDAERDKITEALRDRTAKMEVEVFQRAQQLQDANRELRELHEQLEAKVKARTAELESANAGLLHEINERKKTEHALRQSEEKLRQSQKLEAVGRLAGGIAHDFNNLLSVILSYSTLLLGADDMPPSAHADLQEVKRAGERAADLTRQLLAFSRQQVLDLQILDLNEILSNLAKMLRRVLGEDVELRLTLQPRLAQVRADRSQLEQVIMNLVVNARDAMPRGGKLAVETRNVELDEAYAREHLEVVPGPYIMIAVSDSGVGMDKATMARAFEPFFTTKERGKGTGLGLATVFGIVKQCGGSIWVYSELDTGTTFRIYLPRAEGTVRAAIRGEAAPRSQGGEAILIVEDEEQLRGVAVGILERAGYHVIVASGPGEALAIVEQHPERIHLLLTDVVMPKMNGRELADRVKAQRPEIKILFMSGYTDDVILHHGVLEARVAFLQKPLTPDTLAKKVREVLEDDTL